MSCKSPFADVKHAGRFQNEHFELVTETVVGHALQTPVPIIVVVLAERIGTIDKLLPDRPVIRHTHVVFATDPL